MLSKTRGEESAIKTVTLARGTYSGISPPGGSSISGGRSDRSSLPRTSSPDVREKNDPLRLLGSVGIVELLENDTRPTFIVDIADASNYTPGSVNLHILFANNALRSNSSIWDLLVGGSTNEFRDDGASRAAQQFKAWLLSPVLQGEGPSVNPSPVEHGSIVWSCYTLRRRLRVVSGTPQSTDLSNIPSTTNDTTEFAIPSSSSARFSSNGMHKSTTSPFQPEEQDYFGKSATPVVGESARSMPSLGPPPAQETPRQPGTEAVNATGINPKPEKLDLHTPDEGDTPHHDYDVGFFDWTRLSLSASLPRHIQFARSVDWAATPLGPIEYWTNDLRAMCNLIMASPHPAAMYWGDDLVAIYNEAYIGKAYFGFASLLQMGLLTVIGRTCWAKASTANGSEL
jgi:hypothetical protein